MRRVSWLATGVVLVFMAPASDESTVRGQAIVDRACKSVRAGGYVATHLHAQKLTCTSARNKLRRWLGRGRLPRNQQGWLCYREEGTRICSYLGGPSSIAPNFYFVLSRSRAQIAASATRIRRYRAWDADGNPTVADFTQIQEQCQTSSLKSSRPDAWRCIVADPCFENPLDDREVLCVESPWARSGLVVRTRLDPGDRIRGHRPGPWALRVRGGPRCVWLAGATSFLPGAGRLNYFCGRGSRKRYGFGKPDRRRPVWRIRIANDPDGAALRWAPIRFAWR
jgi:hypothetical protein